MARKNGMTGPIPGAGRPKTDYIKKNINISSTANAILAKLPFGEMAGWVSEAIIEKHNNSSSPSK